MSILTNTKHFFKRTFLEKDDINSNTKIALSALLVAMFIVFDRFANIQPIWFIRLSLATVPVMVAAYILGIKWAILVGALGDMLGALFVLPFGTYFFGFTFNWILIGAVFGLLLYRKRNKSDIWLLIKMIIATVIVLVPVQMFLASYWLYAWFNNPPDPANRLGYFYIVGFRAWTFAIVAVIQVAVAWALCVAMKKPIEKFLVIDNEDEEVIIEQHDKS